MSITMFLSMWIPNTASASIMAPIVIATLEQIQQANGPPVGEMIFHRSIYFAGTAIVAVKGQVR